ncbi:hypothetical protein [Polymorphobacter megasporae]|uniref:hypothetical protein n=1 Tax=Glacieibacterium megasporae TaxID=2835787 RepID=UPI001C1DCEB6|nr:hypothetical protein [Polymorphobacter megasporae]UAJ12460.1 hypothetical protein KTC28_21890 [Polymorphobacter megasporae]
MKTMMMSLTRATGRSLAVSDLDDRRAPTSAAIGDLSNLLQVVASVLHLIDRQIDDDTRLLIRAGLSPINAAGDMTCSRAFTAPHRFSLEG